MKQLFPAAVTLGFHSLVPCEADPAGFSCGGRGVKPSQYQQHWAKQEPWDGPSPTLMVVAEGLQHCTDQCTGFLPNYLGRTETAGSSWLGFSRSTAAFWGAAPHNAATCWAEFLCCLAGGGVVRCGVNAQSNLENSLHFPQINRKQSNKQTTTAAKLSSTTPAQKEAHQP